MMKKFYNSYTLSGILIVWHTELSQNPETREQEIPVFAQPGIMQLLSPYKVHMQQNLLNADGVLAAIEYLFCYRNKYGNN